MAGFIVQRIEKKCSSDIDIAVKYYAVLFCLNGIHLSPLKIKIIAFTAVRGSMSYHRKEFIEIFDSSSASLENAKSELMKTDFLVKIAGKTRVNPMLEMDFSENLLLSIKLVKDNDRIEGESTNTVREDDNGVMQDSSGATESVTV